MVDDRPSRFQSWRTRATAGVGGVAALLTSWGIGLFEARTQPAPPGLTAGQPVAAGEWRLRLEGAEAGTVMPDGRPAYGREVLLLTAEVLNRTARTSNSYAQAVKLATPVAGADAQPAAYLTRDRAMLAQLHPGLPERVVFAWTFPRGTKLPERMRFAIVGRDFKPRDNLYAAAGWFNPHTIGTIELPVTRSTHAATRSPFGVAR